MVSQIENFGIPRESAGKLYWNVFRTHPEDKKAVIDVKSGEFYTYGQLIELSRNLAINLQQFGIGRNDIIAISAENSRKFIVAVLAALYLAVPIHLLNPKYTEYELKHLLTLSKPKIVFCSNKSRQNLMKIKNDFEFIETIILFDDDNGGQDLILYKNLINKSPQVFQIAEIDDPGDQVAVICNSSGTTGFPKGVMLSHNTFRVWFAQARNLDFYDFVPKDNILVILPFFHLGGLHFFNKALYVGSTQLTMDGFAPEIFCDTIQKYRLKHLLLVPYLVHFLANSPMIDHYNLSSVKSVHVGGAPSYVQDNNLIQEKLNLKKVLQAYGVTEIGAPICSLKCSTIPAGSSGKVSFGFQLKIIDVDTRQEVGANKNGEICIKGHIMKGYLNDIEKTKEAIDSDGFLHTGDLGYYDDDGFLYVIGRIKEIIKYKAFQVSPIEIEDILTMHPSIKEAAVVGKPDRRFGELAVGFVVKKTGTSVTEQEILDYLAGFVSEEKRLHGGVRFIDCIPRSSLGKICRQELQQILQ